MRKSQADVSRQLGMLRDLFRPRRQVSIQRDAIARGDYPVLIPRLPLAEVLASNAACQAYRGIGAITPNSQIAAGQRANMDLTTSPHASQLREENGGRKRVRYVSSFLLTQLGLKLAARQDAQEMWGRRTCAEKPRIEPA